MNISLVTFINFKKERYSRDTKDNYLINSLFGAPSNYNSKKESATIRIKYLDKLLFLIENMTWYELQTLLSGYNIKIYGGSVTSRHMLSPIDFMLS